MQKVENRHFQLNRGQSQQAGLTPLPLPGPSFRPPLVPPLKPTPPIPPPVVEPPLIPPGVAIGGLIAIDSALLAYDCYECYKLYRSYKLSHDTPGIEPTPTTNPTIYEPVRGTPGKRNRITGEIWEKDKFHKSHYEVYKNKKDYENGRRDRSVWEDGRLKEKF